MSILSICAQQIDRYSFKVYNVTSQEAYDDAGIDLTDGSVTEAKLYFKKVNDLDANAQEIDILSRWDHLFDDNFSGITIDITEFTNGAWMGYCYFPDWMYEIKIVYTYDGTEYECSKTVGFRDIILHIVYQQMLQSNWKKELSCNCGCENWSSALRKFNYLMFLDIDAELCLVNEYLTTLVALYKITGTDHEYV